MLIRVVDTETTGLDDPAEMVEVGWTDLQLLPAGWAIVGGPYSALIYPGVPITYGAMAVHHITEDMVFSGQSADEVRGWIGLGADYLCAHNSAFDGRFLRGHGVPWLCTFKAARTAWPHLQSHGNGAIRYELGLCLDDERTMPAHRAGPDTWITAHILIELLKLYSPDELATIAEQPVLLRKIGFGQHEGKPFADLPTDYLEWMLTKSNMPSDPKRVDEVHTARVELAKRRAAEPPRSIEAEPDPDAWRSSMRPDDAAPAAPTQPASLPIIDDVGGGP